MLAIYGKENQTNWDEFIPTALFAYRTSVQETTQLSPFETLYGREARLPNDLESLKSKKDVFVKDFESKWKLARERIIKVNKARKLQFDSTHKRKHIEIGDNVRLHKIATKVGLKYKLRGDIWDGPFKVIGKLPNGNLKLNINKNTPYITHPDRVKLAEEKFIREYERKSSKPKVKFKFRVQFSDVVEAFD